MGASSMFLALTETGSPEISLLFGMSYFGHILFPLVLGNLASTSFMCVSKLTIYYSELFTKDECEGLVSLSTED